MNAIDYKKSKYNEFIPAYIGIHLTSQQLALAYDYAIRYYALKPINDPSYIINDPILNNLYIEMSIIWGSELYNFINYVLPLQTVKDCEKAAMDYIRKHWCDGGSCEFDTSINDISRRSIDLFLKEKGTCFLGKVNYNEESDLVDLIPYDPNMIIFNFQYSFIVPVYDQKLIDMIVLNRKEQNPRDRYKLVDLIHRRVIELNGILLTWA